MPNDGIYGDDDNDGRDDKWWHPNDDKCDKYGNDDGQTMNVQITLHIHTWILDLFFFDNELL